MNTPDTEWEKEFQLFWDEHYGNRPVYPPLKAFVTTLLNSEWNKGFEKGRSEYLDKVKDIDEAITSHTTYWKERVRNEQRKHNCPPDDGNDYDHGAWEACESILDNLK